MAPLFLEPVLAYLLYYVVLGCLDLFHRRDKRKLDNLNNKMRKMVAELKVDMRLTGIACTSVNLRAQDIPS